MNYSIKKDSKPEDTVKRIKSILDELNIETLVYDTGYSENYHSLRIKIKNTAIGTNGKGTSKVNALASGYAEFMERLQSQFLISFDNNDFFYEADEKICDYDNNNMQKALPGTQINFEELLKTSSYISKEKLEKLNSKVIYAPFVSFKKKEMVHLPIFLLRSISGSNGLAAGNTFEEACVQGLSEVIERHCLRQAFVTNLKLPTIPKKYYDKYKKIKNLINEIENLGYKITIKDSSLGKNFPTICIIFEDLKYPKNGVAIKFGTHPYFPIALERTLTEFLQNFQKTQEDREKIKIYCLKNDVKLDKIIVECFSRTTFIKKTNKYIQNILSEESDYKFNKAVWLHNESLNNKKIFNHLANSTLKYVDDIYVRNYSFLGFPSVQIYIPNFSSPYVLNDYFFNNWTNLSKCFFLIEEKQKINNEVLEEIAKLSYFVSEFCSNVMEREMIFGELRAKYFLFGYSLIKKDKKNIRKYLNKIIKELSFDNGFKNNDALRFYQGFNRFFKLSFSNKDETKIKEKIEKQYSEEIYDRITKTIQWLDFEAIKQHIVYQENANQNDTKEISKILGEKCKKNPPKQDEILKIINYGFKNNIGKFLWNITSKKMQNLKTQLKESKIS